MSRAWRPVAPDELLDRLASWLADRAGVIRVAVDGPVWARPDELGASLVPRLRGLGRPVAQVRALDFWRDASLRLEPGREDVDSFLTWVDAEALRREVLDPVVASRRYLPTLRDPVTNRSTRDAARPVEADTVLIVSGEFLLGRGLPFDHTVHLTMSRAARSRCASPDQKWMLPGYDRYDRDVRPADVADIVVKLDDARHPAVRGALS